ncbi:hypothetical protein G6F56_004139 [Rhizopus delemar]|nr:hypothetical protein G6F56_004139 [Rhizopus delemar]
MEGNPWAFDTFIPIQSTATVSQEEIVRAMEYHYVTEIEKLKHEQASWIYEIQLKAEQQIDQLKQELREEMRSASDKHTYEFRKGQQDCHAELAKMKTQNALEVNSLKTEVDVLRSKLGHQIEAEQRTITPLREEIQQLRAQINQLMIDNQTIKTDKEEVLYL